MNIAEFLRGIDARQRLFAACAAVVALAIVAVYACIAWTPILNDAGGDSAVYLHTAKYYSPYSAHDEVAAFFARQSQYPPVYPLLLAAVGGAESLLVAHLLTSSLLVAAIAAMFCWLRREGVGAWISLWFAAALALLPGMNTQAMYLLSEAPFLLFCALSLWAMAGLQRESSWRWVAFGALASAGAYLTRSVGIVMVLVWLAQLLLLRPRKWLTGLSLCLLPIVFWRLIAPQESASYLDIMRTKLGDGGFANLPSVLAQQVTALLNGWRRNLTGAGSNNIGADIIGLACLAAWGVRAYRRKADALLVAAYVGIITIWPFPAEGVRLVLPLVPVLLGELCICAAALPVPLPKRWASLPALAAIALAVISALPQLIGLIGHFREELPAELEAYRRSPYWQDAAPYDYRLLQLRVRRQIDANLQAIGGATTPQDCIYSVKPSVIGFHARRMSRATPLNLRLVTVPEQGGCRFVYMLPFATPTYSAALYPLEAWRERLEILQANNIDSQDETSPVIGILARVKSP